MTAQIDHYEIHSFTATYPINEEDLKNVGLHVSLDDLNDLFRPYIETVKPASRFEEFKELILREVISYGARSITDRGPTYTIKQKELRDLREKLALPSKPTEEEKFTARLCIAQSVWVNYTLKNSILRKFKHTNDDVHRMIYSAKVTNIPQLYFKYPEPVSEAIRMTITEEISEIEKNGNKNFFTQKVTMKGPRPQTARRILTMRIKTIFKDLKIDRDWVDDLIDGILLVLGIKNNFD